VQHMPGRSWCHRRRLCSHPGRCFNGCFDNHCCGVLSIAIGEFLQTAQAHMTQAQASVGGGLPWWAAAASMPRCPRSGNTIPSPPAYLKTIGKLLCLLLLTYHTVAQNRQASCWPAFVRHLHSRLANVCWSLPARALGVWRLPACHS